MLNARPRAVLLGTALVGIVALTAVAATRRWSTVEAHQHTHAPHQLQPVGQAWGVIGAVSVRDDVAVIGHGMRIRTLGISDPDDIKAIGQSPVLSGMVQSVVQSGSRVWATAGWGGLHALDVSDPASPTVIGRHQIAPGISVSDLSIHDQTLLVRGNERGYHGDHDVWILTTDYDGEFGDQPATRITEPSEINDALVLGNTLYVAAGRIADRQDAYLKAYDIANPGAPKELWSQAMPVDPTHFAVVQNRLLMITFHRDHGTDLVMMDVSDDGSLTEVARAEVPIYGVSNLSVDGRRVMLLRTGFVHVYDIAPDGTPEALGWSINYPLRFSWGTVSQLTLIGDLAYVATGHSNGLLVIDISDPTATHVLGSHAGASTFIDLAVTRTQLFATASVGDSDVVLHLWRDRMHELVPTSSLHGVTASAIDALPSDETLVAIHDQQLRVLDVGDPQAVGVTGLAGVRAPTERVQVLGDVALLQLQVGAQQDEAVIELYDLSDPGAPQRLRGLGPLCGFLAGSPRQGDLLYILTQLGLSIYDISDRERIRQLSSLDVEPECYGVLAVHRDRAYIATKSALYIVDVSDPRHPREVAIQPLPDDWHFTLDAAVLDGRLVLSTNRCLAVFDLGDPDRPVLVAEGWSDWVGGEMVVSDGLVYIAHGSAGVSVWRIPEVLPTPRPITPTLTPSPTPSPTASPSVTPTATKPASRFTVLLPIVSG